MMIATDVPMMIATDSLPSMPCRARVYVPGQVPYDWQPGMKLYLKSVGEWFDAPPGTFPGAHLQLTMPSEAESYEGFGQEGVGYDGVGQAALPPGTASGGASALPTPHLTDAREQHARDEVALAQSLVDRILNLPPGRQYAPTPAAPKRAATTDPSVLDTLLSAALEKLERRAYDDFEQGAHAEARRIAPGTLAPPLVLRSLSKVATAAAQAVHSELRLAQREADGAWAGDEPVSWSTFLLPEDASSRNLFPLANLQNEPNIVDARSGRSCLAWRPPPPSVSAHHGASDAQNGTEPADAALLRACELYALCTAADGNCLLHAAALGAWGVHDFNGALPVGALRAMVCNLLRCGAFVAALLPRMRAEQRREYRYTAAEIAEDASDEVLLGEVRDLLRSPMISLRYPKISLDIITISIRAP